MTAEQAEAMYQQGLATHRDGYIPVFINVINQANNASGLPWEYGGDAGAARGVFLQDEKNRDHFLREVEEDREELYAGYSEWSRNWLGTRLMVLFPYDVEFFSSTKRIEIEIRYGGLLGDKKRRATFPKKMGQLLVEQMAGLGGRQAVGF